MGPNGSGKSNVIDSILFVFGYRSKQMRSKNISVLIHSSSEHPNLNSCSVAVHFQMINDTGVRPEISHVCVCLFYSFLVDQIIWLTAWSLAESKASLSW